MALIAKPITADNLPKVERLYAEFAQVAETDYRWGALPVPFNVFSQIISQGFFQGYLLQENAQGNALGMLLFEVMPFDTLDIRLFHLSPQANAKLATTQLFEKLLKDWDQQTGPSVVNFAMVGPAHLDHVQYLPWQGFKPVGQAVMHFNFQDELTASIYKTLMLKAQQNALPAHLTLRPWQTEDENTIGPLVYDVFQHSVDALWDPRLWQPERIGEIISFITQNEYGQFIPQATSIITNEQNQPIGFCFVCQTTDTEANIPLIGIDKNYRKKGLGPKLILNSINGLVKLMTEGKIGINKLSATVATDNYSAVKMYRHLGFEEAYWYPHLYLTKSMRNSPSVITNC